MIKKKYMKSKVGTWNVGFTFPLDPFPLPSSGIIAPLMLSTLAILDYFTLYSSNIIYIAINPP